MIVNDAGEVMEIEEMRMGEAEVVAVEGFEVASEGGKPARERSSKFEWEDPLRCSMKHCGDAKCRSRRVAALVIFQEIVISSHEKAGDEEEDGGLMASFWTLMLWPKTSQEHRWYEQQARAAWIAVTSAGIHDFGRRDVRDSAETGSNFTNDA